MLLNLRGLNPQPPDHRQMHSPTQPPRQALFTVTFPITIFDEITVTFSLCDTIFPITLYDEFTVIFSLCGNVLSVTLYEDFTVTFNLFDAVLSTITF